MHFFLISDFALTTGPTVPPSMMAKQDGDTTKEILSNLPDETLINSKHTPGYGTSHIADNYQLEEKNIASDSNCNRKKENELTAICGPDSDKLIVSEEGSDTADAANKISIRDIIILASLGSTLIFANISVSIEAPFFPLVVGISPQKIMSN